MAETLALKELIYLREQLIAASNPNNPDKLLKFQYVKEYEARRERCPGHMVGPKSLAANYGEHGTSMIYILYGIVQVTIDVIQVLY